MATGRQNRFAATLLLASSLASVPQTGLADHSWNTYHWKNDTTRPFTVRLRDNVSGPWEQQYNYLLNSSTEWSVSIVLDTQSELGIIGFNTKRCPPTTGIVEICNNTYGKTGWLGIAQVWLTGGHIVQGVVKLNDSYFNTAKYNTEEWRRMVMCQEIGHTIGLDHVDEAFDNPNVGTCMDYTNDPAGLNRINGPEKNVMPNAHDYDQLGSIYASQHTAHTANQTVNNATGVEGQPGGNSPLEWGKLVRSTNSGFTERYERLLGGGKKLVTFVIWTEDRIRGQH